MKTLNVPVGATVQFHIAGKPLRGQVLRDRGPIGMGGRHLYDVRYEFGKGNWHSTELSIDEIEHIEYKPVNERRKRIVGAMIPIRAVEAHSLFAKPELANSLATYLRSLNVRFSEDPDAIPGEVNLLIDKSTPWDDFVAILNDWKQWYAEMPTSPSQDKE